MRPSQRARPSTLNASFHSPVCSVSVPEQYINDHLDSDCKMYARGSSPKQSKSKPKQPKAGPSKIAPIFSQAVKRSAPSRNSNEDAEIEISDSEDVKTSFNVTKTVTEQPPAKRPRTTQGNVLAAAPLAERMRPKTLDDVVGHEHMTAPDSLLRNLMESGGTGSMILVSRPHLCP